MCLRYILGPHLITRNGYWIRSLSSSTPIYSKPLCSMTQCNVIEFSCYKFRGKRTKKHISNIRKIFGNFINLMCDLRTNFSLSFIFLVHWVISLSLIYGHLWWYCSTSDKHVSGNEKEHLTFLAPWQWLKTLAQSARIKTLSTMKSERFSNGTGTLKDRNSISHALISCVICSSKPSIENSN